MEVEAASSSGDERQWHGLRGLLTRAGPFAPDGFEPDEELLEVLQEDQRVLVIGAGGLGCELLKDLALSGFRDLTVIDLDSIDLSNLNRQFLFRKADVGKSKADVAAAFIRARCPDVQVEAHSCKIQDFPSRWYKKFNIVIAGLDNLEARLWINKTLNDLVTYNEEGNVDPDSVIPLIDGGTEGFRGQARVFFPKVTSCFECSLDSMPTGTDFHLCTIASVPRIPEHCIAYAHLIEWPRLIEFNGVDDYKLFEPKDEDDIQEDEKREEEHGIKLDKDSPEHMSWLFNRASKRAADFGIEGVTYKLTQQVVKNIIPAIASTNAIIAAACVNEAVKIVTRSSYFLNNFMAYNGVNTRGCMLHHYAKLESCSVCRVAKTIPVDPNMSIEKLLAHLSSVFGLDTPSLFKKNGDIVYLATQHDIWKGSLPKSVREVFGASGAHVTIMDSAKKEVQAIFVFNN